MCQRFAGDRRLGYLGRPRKTNPRARGKLKNQKLVKSWKATSATAICSKTRSHRVRSRHRSGIQPSRAARSGRDHARHPTASARHRRERRNAVLHHQRNARPAQPRTRRSRQVDDFIVSEHLVSLMMRNFRERRTLGCLHRHLRPRRRGDLSQTHQRLCTACTQTQRSLKRLSFHPRIK
jgi:hypothetical protein